MNASSLALVLFYFSLSFYSQKRDSHINLFKFQQDNETKINELFQNINNFVKRI